MTSSLLSKIVKVFVLITFVISFLSIAKLNSVKAIPPFEMLETFDYPDGTSPATNWVQIFSECRDGVGCYEISDVYNSDDTKPHWTVKKGRYEIHSTPHENLTFIRSFPQSWPANLINYSVSFDIHILGDINQDRNFAFRYIDPNKWYEIHFYSNNIYMDKAYFDTFTKKNKGKNLGGKYYNFSSNTTYRFKIEAKGNEFKLYDLTNNSNDLLIAAIDQEDPHLYGPAGPEIGSGINASSNVWFDNIIVNNLDPNFSPTPTVTPTPPPQKKVVLAPGMGASWNTDAILNCKLDNYEGNWTMAPFAEEIYKPIISSLERNGFEVFPFYYDWRRRVPSHSAEIGHLISNLNLAQDEKVNFVGHSMGGLVGRAYLENSSDNKIYKYISAGSPHQGTTLAYPAWYGGEIWNNSLVTKIAGTLLLKRCGINHKNNLETLRSIVPSFQDLLPTYKFLRDPKTKELKGLNTNSWFLESKFPQNVSANIATLSGFGFDTLSNLEVKKPNKKEEKNGLWKEGKPTKREFTTEGDGTVLVKSSKIISDNVDNFEINQDHGGLISSQEGIETIINYLKGTPQTTAKNISEISVEEPKSALVLISYPASFISFDTQNKPKKDKNNVVAHFNPKSGKYKIGILPLADQSTLLVGQFLKDGSYSWKEYKIKGKLPLVKNINFNEDNLAENPLQ